MTATSSKNLRTTIGALPELTESESAPATHIWSHFLRKAGFHLSGKCSQAVSLAGLFLAAASLDAWSQGAPADKAAASPSSDRAVTFADLHGTTIDVKMTRDQVVQQNGRQYSVTVHSDATITVARDGLITQVSTPTTHTPRGIRRGKTLTGSFMLDDVRAVSSNGGGQATWRFDGGTLVTMRTFKEGAYRRTIAFARGPDGLTCAVSEGYAREKGSGPIMLKSAIDGDPTMIVSSKLVSSTCRIGKRG
jgi:hypothetical protein